MLCLLYLLSCTEAVNIFLFFYSFSCIQTDWDLLSELMFKCSYYCYFLHFYIYFRFCILHMEQYFFIKVLSKQPPMLTCQAIKLKEVSLLCGFLAVTSCSPSTWLTHLTNHIPPSPCFPNDPLLLTLFDQWAVAGGGAWMGRERKQCWIWPLVLDGESHCASLILVGVVLRRWCSLRRR